MIMLIILGASFLNFTLASAGLANELDDFLAGLGLGRMELLFVIVLLYIVLGMFIETLSLMVVTIPIIVPIILQLDFDVIWFGILMIVLVEMALITPPVGLNLYVVQSARDRGTITDVMIGSLPYVMVMIVMLILLIVFPEIATWLPNSLESR
jgi:TRAP-type C4-dicarboxylate transport system permease large subunit